MNFSMDLPRSWNLLRASLRVLWGEGIDLSTLCAAFHKPDCNRLIAIAFVLLSSHLGRPESAATAASSVTQTHAEIICMTERRPRAASFELKSKAQTSDLFPVR